MAKCFTSAFGPKRTSLVANALNLKGAIEGGDEDARNELRRKWTPPDGLKRFSIATGQFSTQVGFGNNLKKMFFASSELGAVVAIDLKFCALKIIEGAKPLPLVKLLAKDEAA